jgi:hypothetical protein
MIGYSNDQVWLNISTKVSLIRVIRCRSYYLRGNCPPVKLSSAPICDALIKIFCPHHSSSIVREPFRFVPSVNQEHQHTHTHTYPFRQHIHTVLQHKMNLSFDGVVSNTCNALPQPSTDSSSSNNQQNGSQNKRPIESNQQSSQNKRSRRDRPSQDGATQSDDSQPMSDDSMTSVGSLDEFAETLRECTQNLDSYYLDSSFTRLPGFQGRRGGGPPLNMSNRMRREEPDRL